VTGPEVSKDLVFDRPKEPYEYGKDGWQYRDFTVTEVEGICWRIRAAGGTDSTPVRWDAGKRAIVARGVEASPIYEVPTREPEVAVSAPPEPPVWWRKPAEVAGALIAVPLVLVAVLYAWAFLLAHLA